MEFKIERLNKVISSTGSLVIFKTLIDKFRLKTALSKAMPQANENDDRGFLKFQNLDLGFIAGAGRFSSSGYTPKKNIDRPQFPKAICFYFVNLPVQIVSYQGRSFISFPISILRR